MSEVSAEFLARWRGETETLSFGDAMRVRRPTCQVFVRTGRLRRKWKPWTGPEINAYQVGSEHNDEPWQATYVATSDWIEIPNIISVDIDNQMRFGGDGAAGSTATINVDNTFLEELSPMGDIYHAIRRGWLSPWRGYDTTYVPAAVESENDWFRLVDQRLQVKIYQGWGDEMVPTFLGFFDDDDIAAMPDRLTITARCASAILADQRFYGWSKERGFHDPITFADRSAALELTRVGSNASASSNNGDADLALDGESETRWVSDSHATSSNTEWIQIEIPEGQYSSFRINTRGYPGMTAYISIDSVDGEVDGVPVADGWVDNGSGTVPAESYEYVKQFDTIDGIKIVQLPFTFYTAGGSFLRISFRPLKFKGTNDYRAGVIALKAIRWEVDSSDANEGWILVDDVADIVRLILRWCGFKEWYVEDAGIQLRKKWVVNRESFLMDMIDDICQRTGFVFFIDDPSDDDNSLGYPVFRANRALFDEDADVDVPEITEDDLLSRIQTKFTTEPLTYNIRVRGTTATKSEGGVILSRDERRLLAYYLPPWTDDGETIEGTRTAGILRRTFVDRFWIKKQALLEYTARIVAFYQALACSGASFQIPANPGIVLDQHVYLYDTSTGLNTRMWTQNRSSTFAAGNDETEPKWEMTVGGALLDTPFIQGVRDDIRELDEDYDA